MRPLPSRAGRARRAFLTRSRYAAVGLAAGASVLASVATAGRASAQDSARAPAPAAAPATATRSTAPAAPAPARGVWGPAPQPFPAGAELMVITGVPAAGPTAVALRVPDGYALPPTAFAREAQPTVMEGRFLLGRGARADGKGATLTPLSDAQTLKAGEPVYGRARGRTVLQLESVGPLDARAVGAADVARPGAGRP